MTNFYNELQTIDPKNILPGTYFSLTWSEETDLSKIYGPNYETLLAPKQEHDPHSVFKLALPKI
jgi:hypothetical protein